MEIQELWAEVSRVKGDREDECNVPKELNSCYLRPAQKALRHLYEKRWAEFRDVLEQLSRPFFEAAREEARKAHDSALFSTAEASADLVALSVSCITTMQTAPLKEVLP